MTEVDISFLQPSWLETLKQESVRLLRSLIRHGISASFYAGGYLAWVHWHG